MKPDRHVIPLTQDERDFVVTALATAIERGLNHVVTTAAVITTWPQRPDGMFEIALDDDDRQRVYGILRQSQLESFGMKYRMRLHIMFLDYKLDTDAVTALLKRTVPAFAKLHTLPDYVRRCLFEQGHFQMARAHVSIDSYLRLAFEACGAAGLGKLHVLPATDRRRFARLCIDWSADMYSLPHYRRPPAAEPPVALAAADDEAIGEIAA